MHIFSRQLDLIELKRIEMARCETILISTSKGQYWSQKKKKKKWVSIHFSSGKLRWLARAVVYQRVFLIFLLKTGFHLSLFPNLEVHLHTHISFASSNFVCMSVGLVCFWPKCVIFVRNILSKRIFLNNINYFSFYLNAIMAVPHQLIFCYFADSHRVSTSTTRL